MVAKCKKCGNKDNYNFALNIGLCNSCIGNELDKIDRWRVLLARTENWFNTHNRQIKLYEEIKKELGEDNDDG